MSDTAPRKENTEAKKAREKREQQELHERRNQQLLDAQKALETLKEHLHNTTSTIKECEALSSHSKGFYEEINKLAKGKVLIGVTDLAVTQANDIIRDAKKIIKKDVHLDRIKEFVPAGDNPVYPDVLVIIRSVRDSLDRCDEEMESRVKTIRRQIEKARTAIGALEYFLDDETEEGEDEDKNYPTKSNIEPYVEGSVSDSCFSQFTDTYEKYFDFERLDRQSLQEYLSMHEGSERDQAETNPEDQGLDSAGDAESLDEDAEENEHDEEEGTE